MSTTINRLRKYCKNLIKDGFAHVFVGSFLNKAVSMISSIVVARFVSKDQYAYLNYSDTIYGYLMLFSGLGLSSALLKYVSGKQQSSLDVAYFRFSLKTGIFFQFFASIILCFIAINIALPFEKSKPFILIGVLYPSLCYILDVFLVYIRAKQKYKTYTKLSFLQSLLMSALSIIFVFLLNAYGVVLARYITAMFMIVITIKIIKDVFNVNAQSLSAKEKKTFMFMGLNIVIANAFSGMMPFNEHLLISNLIANEEVTANFRVAGLFPQMLLLITQAVNIYFFPIISQISNSGGNVRNKVIKIGVFNLVLVLIGTILGMLFSPWLISFFYGAKYMDAVNITYILWAMRGINAGLRMVPMNMIIAIGKQKFNLFMSIIAFALQLGLDYIFIKNYGVIGVAYGGISVYLLTGLLYWLYFLNAANDKHSEEKNL